MQSPLVKSSCEALCPTGGGLCSHWLGAFQKKQGLCECGCGSSRIAVRDLQPQEEMWAVHFCGYHGSSLELI